MNPIRSRRTTTPLPLLIAFAAGAALPTSPGPARAGSQTRPAATRPAATQPAATRTAVNGAAKIQAAEVKYEVDGTELTGYLAYDASHEGKRPGVLVVHEWWGHNDYARKRARMLAEIGYTALALDMYGDGKIAAHPQDAQKFMMEVMSNMDTGVARFNAAHALLRDHPTTDPDMTAAIGYCFGGGVVLHMARIGTELDAVASFHGSLGTQSPAAAGAVKARVLVLHGAADPFVSADELAGFKKEMADAEVDMKFVAYPGVKHSFTNPGATAVGKKFELPLVYDADADRASWAELDSFLRATFSG